MTTNLWSSELAKLASNAFLAQRISSINSFSELCEKTGANINELSKAIGMDSRIGSKFLKASVGFGGSCFQKDILNLVYIAESIGLNEVADYWNQVILFNNHQRIRFAKKIISSLYNTVSDKKITFLGWTFKKDTNDSRESAAIYVANILIEESAKISVYDPKASLIQMQSDLNYLNSRSSKKNLEYLTSEKDPYKAIEGAHALAILTEWDMFIDLDWKKIFNIMEKPSFIFDGRNLLDKKMLEKIGFKHFSIGT